MPSAKMAAILSRGDELTGIFKHDFCLAGGTKVWFEKLYTNTDFTIEIS